jgi:hypothetical protein
MTCFSFSFTVLRDREQWTVGVPRATAVGHDVSLRSVNASKIGRHAARAVDLTVPTH